MNIKEAIERLAQLPEDTEITRVVVDMLPAAYANVMAAPYLDCPAPGDVVFLTGIGGLSAVRGGAA